MGLLFSLKRKREVDYNNAIVRLVVAAILLGISAMIMTQALPAMVTSVLQPTYLSVGIILLALAGGFFLPVVLQLVMTTLGGKGRYVHGLFAISQTMLVMSVGIFIFSILAYVPVVGNIVGAMIATVLIAVAYAQLYSLTRNLYETDMITTFIGVSILITAMFMLGWLAVGSMGLTSLYQLGGIPSTLPLKG